MWVDLFDVFHGCLMVFVSENLKNRDFLTFMVVFLDGYVCCSIYLMFFSDVNIKLWMFYGFCQ